MDFCRYYPLQPHSVEMRHLSISEAGRLKPLLIVASMYIVVFAAEEPRHHAMYSSDQRVPESPAPRSGAGGRSWVVFGLAGMVAVSALLVAVSLQT